MRCFLSTLAAVLVVCLAAPVFAQDQSEWKAQDTRVDLEGFRTEGGVVNFTEGDAVYSHPGAASQELKPKQILENGDEIQTGPTGRTEILLNPGYFLRLSANTRMLFQDLSPHNLKLKITRGSAIIEMCVVEWFWASSWEPDPTHSFLYEPITLVIPQSESAMVSGGIYRFDVGPDGSTELAVTKGRAFFAGNRVESGNSAIFRNGVTSLAKLGKDSGDAFDSWSRERADLLVKANQLLRNTSWHSDLRRNPQSYLNIKSDEQKELAEDGHIVSALGGFVRFVEPGALVQSEGSEWAELTTNASLKYGDRVKTSSDTRAEINVYATCSLFLAGNTEIIYDSRLDGDAAIKVLRGSAIIFLNFGDKGKDRRPLITFAAPQIDYEIASDGVYQLNASTDASEMKVYWGKVRTSSREVHENKKAVFHSGALEVSSLSKKARDSFYVWSQKRVTSAYARKHRVEYFGMWYLDSRVGDYTLVSGIWSVRSPYGGQYRVGFLRRGRR